MSILKRLALSALGALPVVAQLQAVTPVTGMITGISNITGQRPARVNINDMYAAGGPVWDLYILAMSDLQNQTETSSSSYFSISGIHGRPFTPWNGVAGVGYQTGYCPHGDIQFASWHRPYVALFEQMLGQHAQTIASTYTGRSSTRYRAAARTLRIPYWDWALDARLPPITVQPRITVTGPGGKVNIPNPLYSYRWLQFPLNKDPAYFPDNADNDVYNVAETFRGRGDSVDVSLDTGQLRDQIYTVLSTVKSYDIMASTRSRGASFEDPHNSVHTAIGGFMWWLDISAFDPIFWLHHSNVDRLVALWQAINYNDTFQESPTQSTGQFATAAGTLIDANSPLKPFYQENGQFHNGRTASSTVYFGYTYPEINDWSFTPDETKETVTYLVNLLYGSSTVTKQKKRKYPIKRLEGSWKQYSVEIGVERSELELPVTIDVMIGDVCAGSVAVLSMPSTGLTYSEIQLNRGISKVTPSLERDAVIPILEQQFRIEIRKSDGSLIPVESVPSLTIDVRDEDVTAPPSPSQFPTHGATNSHPQIGRPARK